MKNELNNLEDATRHEHSVSNNTTYKHVRGSIFGRFGNNKLYNRHARETGNVINTKKLNPLNKEFTFSSRRFHSSV